MFDKIGIYIIAIIFKSFSLKIHVYQCYMMGN